MVLGQIARIVLFQPLHQQEFYSLHQVHFYENYKPEQL
ncbi:hypothetical protein [Escherichia coli IS5]|nr:hypothetical protein [Escherichia coli IS5]